MQFVIKIHQHWKFHKQEILVPICSSLYATFIVCGRLYLEPNKKTKDDCVFFFFTIPVETSTYMYYQRKATK